MTTLLDPLAQIGRVTWDPVWVPVLAWTVFALPLWALLARTDRLHPNAEYRLWQTVLVTLPVGVAAAAMIDGWGPASNGLPDVGLSVVVMPPIEAASEASPSPTVTWMHAMGLATVVAAGAGLMGLVRLALDAVAVARVRRQMGADSRSDTLQTRTDCLTNSLGVRRSVRVREAPEAEVPVTLGGLRPLLLLPPHLTHDAHALRMTLVHELVHIRRYDDWAHLVERFIAALFRAHPLVGRLTNRIAEARERACDVAVLADEQTSAAAYARLLTAFAQGRPRRLGALSLSESPSSLTNRLHAMRPSVSRWLSSPPRLIASLLIVGLLVTFGVVACSDSVAPSASESSADPTASSGPSPQSETSGDGVFVVVEERPECGGVRALTDHVQYPKSARKAGIEGRVYVQFVVDENGEVVEPKVTKGVQEALNEEALSAVKKLKCTPGKHRGKAVKVKMALPVTFRLDNGSNDGANGSGNDAATSSATPTNDSGNFVPEKDTSKVVRVLMNVNGELLIGDDRVEFSNLTNAVRKRTGTDAARAALIYADGAPTERVSGAEASLRALDLEKVSVRKVE